MTEFIRNAGMGWTEYTQNGKMIALLFIALLMYWFWKKEKWIKHRALFKYTTVMTACCICPLTAALLMVYQTKFYDYEWIWGIVPIITVIALAITLLWTELESEKGKRLGVLLSLIAILYFCGSMGHSAWDAEKENLHLEETAQVLEIIKDNEDSSDIMIWAPQSVMKYVRALDGTIRMPYGRNMWDAALNAYSYETYGEREQVLYRWMRLVEECGDGDVAAMEIASELGINQILLPEQTKPELLTQIEEYWGVKAQRIGTYYWFSVN